MLSTWQPNGSINYKSRLSFLVGYIFGEKKLKYFFNITNTYDFTTVTPIKKNIYLKLQRNIKIIIQVLEV